MTVAACGESNETAQQPDVQVEAVDDDEAFRLAGGVRVINGCRIVAWTRCPDADLAGENLQDADLREANLYRADLERANLRRADLSGTFLLGANLEDADLRGADLYRADLRGANLRWAKLDGAELSGARFCRTTMPDGTGRNDNC